jgi:DNA-directed RNA polymerase specialized sigma24 family protein
MKLTFEQQQELDRLTRGLPQFDEVLRNLKAFQKGEGDADDLWCYYYPLCLKKAWGFFVDPEDGHDAAFALMEHWLEAIMKFDTTQQPTLMAFFERVSRNFFINYLKHKELGPDVIYGGTPYDVDEMDSEEVELRATEQVQEIGPDYPHKVIQDSPLDLLLVRTKAEQIREDLFPADKEVFDLLLEGCNSMEIMGMLGRSDKAVERSMARIRSLT